MDVVSVFLNINEASPESACVRSGVLLFGVSWPFVKSTAKNTLNELNRLTDVDAFGRYESVCVCVIFFFRHYHQLN